MTKTSETTQRRKARRLITAAVADGPCLESDLLETAMLHGIPAGLVLGELASMENDRLVQAMRVAETPNRHALRAGDTILNSRTACWRAPLIPCKSACTSVVRTEATQEV